MESKAIISLLMLCMAWQGHAFVNEKFPGNNGTEPTSICTQEGFIANPNASDCRTYIQCQRLNGTLVEIVRECWNGSLFDPSSGFCGFNYTCNGSNNTLPGNNGTDVDNSTSICTQEGFIANPNASDCRTYIQCQRLNGTLVEIVRECWNGSLFDPSSGFCGFNYTCNGSNNTLPGNNGTDVDNSTSICTQEGFIANPNASDCRTYIQCQRLNGTLVEIVRECWNGSLFDPSSGFCGFNYTCNGSNNTLPGNNGTDVDNSTSICTQEGFIANPNASDCRTYIQCQRLNGTLVEIVRECWNGSLFDPNSGFCGFNYTCNGSSNTLPGNNGTDVDNSTSICTQEGYIAHPNSTDCRTYIQCSKGNGSFVEETFVCRNNTYFNPNTNICEASYNCNQTDSVKPFLCTSAGQFSNMTDNTCRSYFLCIEGGNGTFIRHDYTCPAPSLFSPEAGFCTTSYTCNRSSVIGWHMVGVY